VGPDYADDLRELGVGDEAVRLPGSCVARDPKRRPADAAELSDRIANLPDYPRRDG
jgi:hypothetical protein